jgi:hypothetical protein
VGTDIDTVNPIGGWESAWISSLSIIVSIVNFGLCVPHEVLSTPRDKWTTADIRYVAAWGLSASSIVLNIASVASPQGKLMKYKPWVGPAVVTAFGGAQVGLGIDAAVEFARSKGQYNAAYSAAAVIGPTPSLFKFLLIGKQWGPLTLLLGLDLVCDLASGCLSMTEAATASASPA